MFNINATSTQVVGFFPPELCNVLRDIDSLDVVMTSERLAKNKRHHPELSHVMYKMLPEVISDPCYVSLDKSDMKVVIFYKLVDDPHLFARHGLTAIPR